jgi:hypothetical protein
VPLLLWFALTLFVSAALLFLIEPMMGKMLLPMLGGTPAVWNTCMVFFQAVLLAGYLYAHATTAWLGARRQALLHLGVLLLPFLTLGLTVDRGLLDVGEGSPIPSLLLALLLSIGLPFFVLSTSASLLQKWFAGTGHPAADDPYFLYGASNLGSLLALLGYPVLIEPWLTLAQQRLLWQIGYGVLVVLTAGCAVFLWSSSEPGRAPSVESPDRQGGVSHHPSLTVGAPTASRRLRWIALAFVPSSLMLGATTYITTDIAPIPLLWVLPLVLYLLSFILVFSRLPAAVHQAMVGLLPYLVLMLVFLILADFSLRHTWLKLLMILAHLSVLFVAAMVCHGELARDRPPPRYLTEFYLWMSVGGVLGGLFNALVAPLLFNGIVEYPLALVLGCLLLPAREGEKEGRAAIALGTALIGFCLGCGAALVLPALAVTGLSFAGLADGNGLWLAAALLAVLIWGAVYVARGGADRAARVLDLALPAALGVLVVGLALGRQVPAIYRGFVHLFAHLSGPGVSTVVTILVFGLPVAICTLFLDRPVRFGLGMGALLLASTFCDLLNDDVRLRQRSFFGVLHVSEEGGFRQLHHGTTLHGMQRLLWDRNAVAAVTAGPLAASSPLGGAALLAAGQDVWEHPGREALTYFHRTGPIGQVFAAYREQLAGRHVGLIGLGTGTLATYGQAGQTLTYYEIDPLVKRVAYDPECFTFLQDAAARGVAVDVVLGDARLKLEERARGGPADRFALLVVDAFSSDAIPIHLLTRQALEIYLANLADDGLLAFHISNRYLTLEPVLGNLAEELGLAGVIEHDLATGFTGKAASSWVVLARQPSTLDRLLHEGRFAQWQEEHGWAASQDAMLLVSGLPDLGGRAQSQGTICWALMERLQAPWRRLKVRPEVGVWTDDYSNLLRVFDWKN